MISIEKIKEEYPLHWLVWNNDHEELNQLLQTEQHDPEKLDSRGRTPLMLAVRLCHLNSVKTLLAAKCNANAVHRGWNVVQEAVCAGDPDILTAVIEVRDLQRHIERVTHVPQLLKKLVEAPDFYIEMKWEFTSWVPLMSRICPSDVYKVYKRGSNVRIDTTLLGFDNTNWLRGNRSYIFKGQADSATMIEVDHEAHEVSVEHLRGVIGDINGIPPARESISARLNATVSLSQIDMDKISFERNKTGIWGWRSDKIESINGYECKAFAASNVEFITKSRTEHLNESQARIKNSRTPLQSFLGLAEEECSGAESVPSSMNRNPPTTFESDLLKTGEENEETPLQPAQVALTPEEYFSQMDLNGRDIGRIPKISSKVQRFKANMWLSEEFPIKLQEQVLPILDLMSTMASPHVSKLKDFITMQLPSGFPVKIEIPLFHVLNACVTFGNVFALETPVPNVTHIREPAIDGAAAESNSADRLTCVIDDSCFDIPPNYTNKGADHRRQLTFEDEDDLLQFAIQQSLMETGSESDQVDIWEALRAQRPYTPNNFADEESQLQRVLQESLYGYHRNSALTIPSPQQPVGGSLTNDSNTALSAIPLPDGIPQHISEPAIDPDLAMALRISEQEQLERQKEIEREQELFEEVLRLSLEEK